MEVFLNIFTFIPISWAEIDHPDSKIKRFMYNYVCKLYINLSFLQN